MSTTKCTSCHKEIPKNFRRFDDFQDNNTYVCTNCAIDVFVDFTDDLPEVIPDKRISWYRNSAQLRAIMAQNQIVEDEEQ